MPLTHTNTPTLLLRTDATGPDLATSFPWGNTRRHWLSGAPLLCFPVLSSCPSPITRSPRYTFVLSSLLLVFIPQTLSFHLLFCCFNYRHLLRNVSFTRNKWFLSCLCFACEHVSASHLDCGVYVCVCVQQWDWIAAVRTVELWREWWCTLPAVYTQTYQTHIHTSTNTHTDWNLPPDLTH